MSLEQACFVEGKAHVRKFLNIRQIVENAREFNTHMFLCFIIKLSLTSNGLICRYLIRSLYESNSAQHKQRTKNWEFLRRNCEESDKDECFSHPFDIFNEYAMRKAVEAWEGSFFVGGHKINNLRYADDITSITTFINDLKNIIGRVETASEERKLLGP